MQRVREAQVTCIVGIAEHGNVWIGGDSAGVSGYSLRRRADEKVFRKGEYLFGFTASFRMGDLLRYSFSPPWRDENLEDREFLCTFWIDAVRRCFGDGGFRKKENDVEEGGTFLLGYRGTLYCVGGDFQIGHSVDGLDACGSGRDLAMGALHATDGSLPSIRVFAALRAAERYSTTVTGPFHIVSSHD